MQRNIRRSPPATPRRRGELAEELAREMQGPRKAGQPTIEEEHFKTGAVRVRVIWDRWKSVPDEERATIISEAYRRVEGDEFAGRMALIGGYTIPEAYAAGWLPFQVIPALRPGDRATREQCHQAMIAAGASILFDRERPQLRFATEQDAAAGVETLVERLPESEHVWLIAQDAGNILESSWDAP